MPPEERRSAIVAVTVPLLREHGRSVTTSQIAKAAGVAEGTIFRAFGTKDELVDEAIRTALDFRPHVAEIAALDRSGTLEDRLLRIATVMHRRFTSIFELMAAVGMMGPPDIAKGAPHGHHGPRDDRDRVARVLIEALGPTDGELRVSAQRAISLLRTLTFAGCNPHMSGGDVLSPEDVVELLLHGIRKDS